MATTYTTNYNLGKQENHADKFDMDVITDNADKIDAALTAKADKSTTYTKTEVDTALSGKQATLTTAQLAAVNSGITSTDVAQIGLNKNNILLNWETGRNVYDWHNKSFTTGDNTTVTDNNNGTYTVTKSATTTGNSFNYALIHLDAGSYVLTGCPSGYNGIFLEIRNLNNQTISGSGDSGSGSSVFTITTSGDYRLNILLASYIVVSNIIFKPMITPSNIYYQGIPFQPYALSNAELTVKEQTNKNNISTEQAKTVGMTAGGTDYITVGGIRVYVSATAPTGARSGDLWIGG